MDTVTQNRITRKKLKKKIKRQASRRINIAALNKIEIEKLRHRINALERKNSDCSKLLEVAIREILDVFNFGEFSDYTPVTFDLGFVKINHFDGTFSSPTVKLPNNEDLEKIILDLD